MVDFKTIARRSEVASAAMKRIEVDGREILLANVDGAFYAVSDRCGHMNASLSAGGLDGEVVTCKMHGARFNVATGEVVAPPPDEAVEQLRGYLEQLGMPDVETCALERYEVRVEGEEVQIRLP